MHRTVPEREWGREMGWIGRGRGVVIRLIAEWLLTIEFKKNVDELAVIHWNVVDVGCCRYLMVHANVTDILLRLVRSVVDASGVMVLLSLVDVVILARILLPAVGSL